MATTQYTSTIQKPILSKIKCEGCSNEFEYVTVFKSVGVDSKGSFSSYNAKQSAMNASLNKMNYTINNLAKNGFIELGIFPCPKCGYKQSFMTKSIKANGFLIFVISIFIGVAFSIFDILLNIDESSRLILSLLGFICIAAGIFIGLFIALSNPNMKWYKAHSQSRELNIRVNTPLKIDDYVENINMPNKTSVCPKCGKNIFEGASNCSYCGTKLIKSEQIFSVNKNCRSVMLQKARRLLVKD